MFVRGPGLKAGLMIETVTSHTDVAPTILDIAGLDETPWQMDGTSFLLKGDGSYSATRNEHVNIEYWGVVSANVVLLCRCRGNLI